MLISLIMFLSEILIAYTKGPVKPLAAMVFNFVLK